MVTGERRMVHDWASGINNWYQFDASGKMVTGWYLDSDNVWYYYGSDGKAVSGITTIGSATYYLASDGRMCTNYSVSIGGIMYYFGADGVLSSTQGQPSNGWKRMTDGWYYF